MHCITLQIRYYLLYGYTSDDVVVDDVMHTVHIHSGGTAVTVYGSHLNSVADPRITLTVVTTFYNDTNSTSSKYETDSEVI